MRQLKTLLDKGIIPPYDYERKKAEILSGIWRGQYQRLRRDPVEAVQHPIGLRISRQPMDNA